MTEGNNGPDETSMEYDRGDNFSLMITAPNSIVSQKEQEEAGGRRKGGLTGTPTPGAAAPTCPFRSGASDARNRRKHKRWCGVLLHRRGREG